MKKNDHESKFTDADLLAYLDGDIDPEAAAQIERSPEDLERAKVLDRLQGRLTSRLYRLECPRSEILGEYHMGLLDQAQAIAVARHLQECPHCTRETDQLRDYLGEAAPPLEPGLFKGIKVLIARVIEELGKISPGGGPAFAPAFATLRGGSQRPVILEADGQLITLDIQPAGEERVTIVGQVAAEEQDLWTGASVELRQDGLLKCIAVLDDLGAFRCEEIPPGRAELALVCKNGPVVLANIEVVI